MGSLRALCWVGLLGCGVGYAQVLQGREYVRSEAMIPVRDGAKLHVVILRPKGSDAAGAEPLPFLMERTPYGVNQEDTKTVSPTTTERWACSVSLIPAFSP